MKSGRFHVKSTCKPYKSNSQEKLFSFMQCSGKAMSDFERPTIARNGKAYVLDLFVHTTVFHQAASSFLRFISV